MGKKRTPVVIDPTDDKTESRLVEKYAVVPQMEALGKNDVFCPKGISADVITPNTDRIPGATLRDTVWYEYVSKQLSCTKQESSENSLQGLPLMWSAYNSALLNNNSIKPTAEISICPLFSEKSSSPSMVKHAMDITTDTTTFLNPGQTPVLGADQPLYEITKTLQWSHSDTSIAEDKFVLKMGDKDKAQSMGGKVVRGSGWEYCVSTANVFTSAAA